MQRIAKIFSLVLESVFLASRSSIRASLVRGAARLHAWRNPASVNKVFYAHYSMLTMRRKPLGRLRTAKSVAPLSSPPASPKRRIGGMGSLFETEAVQVEELA